MLLPGASKKAPIATAGIQALAESISLYKFYIFSGMDKQDDIGYIGFVTPTVKKDYFGILYMIFFPRVHALFLSLILLLIPLPAAATNQPEATITDIIITTSNSHLLLFSSIKNCFTKEMLQGIHNGIPVTFTFTVNLDQVREFWWDKNLTSHSFQHTLTYDGLNEEYKITLSEKDNLTITTSSLAKAKEVMVEVNGLKVIAIDKLVPDQPYALRIKARLAEKTLPLNIHYIVPFISLWDFETDWRTIEFRY